MIGQHGERLLKVEGIRAITSQYKVQYIFHSNWKDIVNTVFTP